MVIQMHISTLTKKKIFENIQIRAVYAGKHRIDYDNADGFEAQLNYLADRRKELVRFCQNLQDSLKFNCDASNLTNKLMTAGERFVRLQKYS